MNPGVKRGSREVKADIAGCETCQHRLQTALFTLCQHPTSKYNIGGKEDFHTVQHMRDEFVGECGAAMALKKAEAPRKPGDGRKWDRKAVA